MPAITPPLRSGRRRPTALLAAVAGLGLALLAAPTAHAATEAYEALTVTADSSVTVGDTVTVSVEATGLVDLYAYTLTVDYDPALLAYDDGSATYPSGGYDSTSADDGTLTFSATRMGSSPGLTGDQNLVTFTFTALASGTAAITLTGGTVVDSSNAIADVTSAGAETVIVATSGADGGGDGTDGGGDGTGGGTGSGSDADGTDSDDAGTGADGDDALAGTGLDAGPWVATAILALGAIAVGVAMTLRRREATR